MNNYLYVFRSAPYGSSMGQEGLDALLVAPAFENIHASVLFIDDGVYQLKNQQTTGDSQLKQYTNTFAALEDFGVEQIYVHSESLQKRGLSPEQLNIDVQLLNDEQVSDLFHQQQRIMGF